MVKVYYMQKIELWVLSLIRFEISERSINFDMVFKALSLRNLPVDLYIFSDIIYMSID